MLYVVALVFFVQNMPVIFFDSRFCFNDNIFCIIRKFGFYKENSLFKILQPQTHQYMYIIKLFL